MAKRNHKKIKELHELVARRYAERRANKSPPIRIKPKPKPKTNVKLNRRIIRRKQLNERGYPLTRDGKLEHREVYKNIYGPIPGGWVVHHIDECKTNNSADNLIALPQSLHHLLHQTMWQSRQKWPKERQFSFLAEKFKELGLTSTRPLSPS